MAKKKAEMNGHDVDKLSIVQPDFNITEADDGPAFKYAVVMPLVDTINEVKVDDDGEQYKKQKRRKRCTSVLFSLYEEIIRPETGEKVMNARPFNLRLPFVTYKNDATHAGFSSEQVIRALMNMPSCQRAKRPLPGDMFYLVPVSEAEIRERTRIASDPELAEKLRRLQEENLKPAPSLGEVMGNLAPEELDEFRLPAFA